MFRRDRCWWWCCGAGGGGAAAAATGAGAGAGEIGRGALARAARCLNPALAPVDNKDNDDDHNNNDNNNNNQYIKIVYCLTINQKIYLARILTISQISKYTIVPDKTSIYTETNYVVDKHMLLFHKHILYISEQNILGVSDNCTFVSDK